VIPKEYVEHPGDLSDLPQWRNKEKVADWANRTLEAVWHETDRQHSELYDGRFDVPPIVVGKPDVAARERTAVAAAAANDFGPLAALVLDQQARQKLSVKTWQIVAEKLTGKFKARRGAKKRSAEERRTKFDVHEAADLVPQVQHILSAAYPRQAAADIRDQALLAVERRTGVPVRRLMAYLSKSKKDRHRAP
jgi:hypothetical protein